MNSNDYISKYINKIGLTREKINKEEIPALDKIKIWIYFGDLNSATVCGRYVYPILFDKSFYNIVVTWPGTSCFFDGVDEIWSIAKSQIIKPTYIHASGVDNSASNLVPFVRSLNENFLDVNSSDCLKKYFKNYLVDEFFKKNKVLKIKETEHFGSNYFSQEFNNKFSLVKNKKIAVVPFVHCQNLHFGKMHLSQIDEEFYVELVKSLIYSGRTVVCFLNEFTWDISKNIQDDNLIVVREDDFKKIISMMYFCDLYIDFFAGMSCLGYMSKAPTLSLVERTHYFSARKNNDDLLFNLGVPLQRMYSILQFCRKDNGLNTGFFASIINRIGQILDWIDDQKYNPDTLIKSRDLNSEVLNKSLVKRFFSKYIKKGLRCNRTLEGMNHEKKV